MNFGYLFEYYTPVTNSLTILVGWMRLISHQTPGASNQWQQPPKQCTILSLKNKSLEQIYPLHVTHKSSLISLPPKKHLGNFNSNTSPLFEVFSKGYAPETCWQRSPWSWQERHSNLFAVSHPNSPHPRWVLGVLKPLSKPTKKAASLGWWVRTTLTWFFWNLCLSMLVGKMISIHCWFAHH